MREEKTTNQELQEDSGGLMDMSTSTQIGIAAGFVGLPFLAGAAELLHLGFTGMVVGAVGVGAVGLVGKHVLEQQKANGHMPHLPMMDRIRSANWGALLGPLDEGIGSESVEEDRQAVNDEEESKTEELTTLSMPEIYNPHVYRDHLFLSQTLFPHADAMLSGRVSIFGIPDAGKSNTVAVIGEELGKLEIPFLLCDTEGEYEPLCDKRYLRRPYIAHASSVTPENARAFGHMILDDGLQVVLNLQSYGTINTAALVMIEIIHGMHEWQEERPQEERIPCAAILDEAHVWLPQRENESMLTKEKDEEGITLLARLQNAFFDLVVRRGRKYGIGFIFASQMIADLDKRAMAANWKFYMKQNEGPSLARYAEQGIGRDVAMALGRGEAVVIGPGVRGVHQIRKRNSPHGAHTPGLANMRRYLAQKQHLPHTEPRLPVPSIPETPAPTYATGSFTTKLPIELQRALELYEPGMSYRELGRQLGVGKDTAGTYIKQLKERRLIEA